MGKPLMGTRTDPDGRESRFDSLMGTRCRVSWELKLTLMGITCNPSRSGNTTMTIGQETFSKLTDHQLDRLSSLVASGVSLQISGEGLFTMASEVRSLWLRYQN